MNTAYNHPKPSPCLYSGSSKTLSSAEQMDASARCPGCGRVLRLRKNESGFAAPVATLPRHNSSKK